MYSGRVLSRKRDQVLSACWSIGRCQEFPAVPEGELLEGFQKRGDACWLARALRPPQSFCLQRRDWTSGTDDDCGSGDSQVARWNSCSSECGERRRRAPRRSGGGCRPRTFRAPNGPGGWPGPYLFSAVSPQLLVHIVILSGAKDLQSQVAPAQRVPHPTHRVGWDEQKPAADMTPKSLIPAVTQPEPSSDSQSPPRLRISVRDRSGAAGR